MFLAILPHPDEGDPCTHATPVLDPMIHPKLSCAAGGYADSMTIEQLMNYHRLRLAPVKGHPAVDVLAFETIPCLKVGFAWTCLCLFSCQEGTDVPICIWYALLGILHARSCPILNQWTNSSFLFGTSGCRC